MSKPRLVILTLMALVFAAPLAAQAASGVVRTESGLRYEIPDGWIWGGFDGERITLRHSASMTAGKTPNALGVSGRAPENAGYAYDQNWGKLDRDERRTLPGGVAARWKAGQRFGTRYGFHGEAALGGKTLVAILERRAPDIDVAVVEAAFLRIAGTLKDVPASATIHHPDRGFSADALGEDSWFVAFDGGDIVFRCWRNDDPGDGYLYAYRGKEFPNGAEALADITGAYMKNHGLKIGKTMSAAGANGDVFWTEQPGTKYPFIGVVMSSKLSIFVTAAVKGPESCTREPSREDFLAFAKSVRAWDGK